MKWAQFNRQIAASRVSAKAGAAGRIAAVLDGLAEVTHVPRGAHAWYPRGVANGAILNNFRYVDQDKSYCGTADAFCAEASSCVILILVDPQSRSHFLAHIAADTQDTGALAAMVPDLHAFMVSVGNDLGRPNVFLFSQTIPRENSTDELDNVMALLSTEIRDLGLGWLANSTYLIEGEGGIGWSPHCAVRLRYANGVQRLLMSFAS